MNVHCLVDRNLAQRGSKLSGECAGVLVGAVCSSETRHGDSLDTAAVQPQHIKCLDGHQKGQGRIESAGNTDDGMLTVGVFQSLFQTHRLDMQDLITAAVAVFLV